MEKCNFQGTEIDLPIDLIENPDIFSHVMSLDTWKHVLTPENRNHLKNYLPVLPTDYPHAQQENLRDLFDGENFKFGNPLETFQRKLQAGYYASDIAKYRKRCKKAKHKEYKLKLKKFYRKLVNDILISRQEIIDQVLSTSHQEVPITLSWHERQMYKSSFLTGNLEVKYKRIMKEVKDECEDINVSSDEEPSELYPQQMLFNGANNSDEFHSGGRDFIMSTASTSFAQASVSEEEYHRILRAHKRKRDNREDYPDLDTRMISLEDVISRTNVTAKKISKTVVKKKSKVKLEKKEHVRKLKKKRNVPSIVSEQPTLPAVSDNNEEEVASPVKVHDDIACTESLKCLENSSACFFSLLRNIFLDLTDATADVEQIERMVKEWQKSSSCSASPWSFKEPNWISLIAPALKYLAGSDKAASFVPLVSFKQKVHQWKWIGAYRDEDSVLVPLCESWFETKDDATDTVEPASPASEASLRTDYVVGPSTSDEKADYQNQERQRYENPHKPFIYQMHGFDSIVAPVKGVFTKESNLNKAREHSLLVSKRPPYVTILTLVRDAAARLPNGEGTRAEVCQLLKDSQYINPDATDGQIHTVVSGALDRLHYEKDPCVKYESARKVWIYLHKIRTVEEFEKIHEASAAAARAKKQMSQKQKLMKQQQKAKETALSISNVSQTSVEEGNGGVIEAVAPTNVVLPEDAPISVPVPAPIPKSKKPTKPKRPTASATKTNKPKGNAKKGSLEMVNPTQPGISQPPQEGVVFPSHPLVHTLPNASAVDFGDHQEQGLFLPPNNSVFSRTSRLNSPFMGLPPPAPFGNQNAGFSVKLEGDYNKGVAGTSSSSSGSESESESESESSSGNDVTRQGLAIPEHRDTNLQFGESQIPLNSVMSLQGNPNVAESDGTFGRYY